MNDSGTTPFADGVPDERVAEILRGMTRVAVVGISDKPERASHGVTRFLAGLGLEVHGGRVEAQDEVLKDHRRQQEEGRLQIQ